MTTAQKLFLEGEEKGRTEGIREGKIEGKIEGKNEGRIEEAKTLAIKLLAKKFQTIPAPLQNKIEKIDKAETFEKIVEEIFSMESLAEVEGLLGN